MATQHTASLDKAIQAVTEAVSGIEHTVVLEHQKAEPVQFDIHRNAEGYMTHVVAGPVTEMVEDESKAVYT